MKKIPSGAWSIWLASTTMGLKYFTIEGFVASVLTLLAVQPFLRKDRKLLYLLSLLAGLILFATLKNYLLAVLILPYLILLAIQKVKKFSQRAYVQIGAVILTIPFPLMAGFYGEMDIFAPWFLLILITIFNVTLADSIIFERALTMKNYLLLILLILSFYFLSPPLMFTIITLVAVLLYLVSSKFTLKQLGFSLLGFHLLFAALFFAIF